MTSTPPGRYRCQWSHPRPGLVVEWTALWSSLKVDSCSLPETTGGSCLTLHRRFCNVSLCKQQVSSYSVCVCIAAVTDTNYIDATSVYLSAFVYKYKVNVQTVKVQTVFGSVFKGKPIHVRTQPHIDTTS